MSAYYDTGIILKLYTTEAESDAVRSFVVRRKAPLRLTCLHLAECASALRLKQFRGECEGHHVARALADIEDDARSGVIQIAAVDWDQAWQTCRSLAEAHAAETGCRTLDALHVACARLLSCDEFITSDRRQVLLARRLGLKAIRPLA